MSLTSLNLAEANKLVLEAFDSGWQSYTPQGSKFFNSPTPDRADERFSVHAASAAIPEVAEDAAYPAVNIVQLGIVTVSQRVFKRELPVSKLMKRFSNYGVVLREAAKLGYRAKYIMDQVMADVLNNGFTTLTAWDGLSLFNGAHLIGQMGTTQSNTLAVDITKANVNTAHVRLQIQQDHGGHVMPSIGKWLVVHPNDQMTAWEAIGSPTDPTTANRSLNFVNTLGLNLVIWPLLTDTDSWFLIAEKMFNRLEYVEALAPEVKMIVSQTSGGNLYQIDFACNAGAPDYLGTVGSQGA